MITSITKINNTSYKLTVDNVEYRVFVTSDNGGMAENKPVWFIDYMERVSDNKYIHGHPLYELCYSFDSSDVKEDAVKNAALSILKDC